MRATVCGNIVKVKNFNNNDGSRKAVLTVSARLVGPQGKLIS